MSAADENKERLHALVEALPEAGVVEAIDSLTEIVEFYRDRKAPLPLPLPKPAARTLVSRSQ